MPVLSSAPTAVGTRERPHPKPGAWLALHEIRLVACPGCGAPNSAARWRCARCGTRFDTDDASSTGPALAVPSIVAPPAHAAGDEPAGVPAVPAESARWLALITVIAGVAVVAVAVMMLAARGIGPFSSRAQPAVPQARQAVVDEVAASTAMSEAGSLVDDDPTTAWTVGDVSEGDQWVDLHLGQPTRIDRLIVWNGDQRSADTFAQRSRVRDVRIEFPQTGRTYKAEFLDQDGFFIVQMKPAPPISDRVRVVVDTVYGDAAGPAALSGLEALVVTPSAP